MRILIIYFALIAHVAEAREYNSSLTFTANWTKYCEKIKTGSFMVKHANNQQVSKK